MHSPGQVYWAVGIMNQASSSQIVRSARFRISAQFIGQASTVAGRLLLVGLLFPEEFGYISLLTVFAVFASVLAEYGLAAPVVQTKDLSRKALNSFFWISVIGGAFMSVLLYCSADSIGVFFERDQLPRLLRLCIPPMAMTFLAGFNSAILQREMRFDQLAYFQAASLIIGNTAMLVGAYLGAGIECFVYGLNLQFLVLTAGLWSRTRFVPSWEFSWSEASSLLAFGYRITAASIVAFATANLATLLVAKALPQQDLGLYALAYQLTAGISSQVNAALCTVLFAAFSIQQDEIAHIRRQFATITRFLAIVFIPGLMIAVFAAPSVIRAVFPPAWYGVAPFVQILCIAGMFNGIGGSIGSAVIMGLGKGGPMLRLNLVRMAVTGGFLWLGAFWGLTGICVAVCVYSVASVLCYQVYANHLMQMPTRRYLMEILPGAVGGLAIAAASLLAFRLLPLGLTSNPYLEILEVMIISLVTVSVTMGLAFRSQSIEFVHRSLRILGLRSSSS